MKYRFLEIPEMAVMTPEVYRDSRGFFMETFRESSFRQKVADVRFLQDNYSGSMQGTLRGLHYQLHHPQGKLVTVTKGCVFDVGVDLRKASPYFGKWAGVVLSEENRSMLWVPPGFAHGFYVISAYAELSYKCTDYYAPEHERGIAWDDADIGIEWPIEDDKSVILSDKDRRGSALKNAEVFA